MKLKKRNYSIDDLNDFGFFSFTISEFFMPEYFSASMIEKAPDYDQTVTNNSFGQVERNKKCVKWILLHFLHSLKWKKMSKTKINVELKRHYGARSSKSTEIRFLMLLGTQRFAVAFFY